MTAVIEDFGAEKNYKNMPCVSVRLRSCSQRSLFSIQLLASVLASQGFDLWQKCVCVVSGEQRLADGHNWPVRRSKNNGERRLQKTSAL